MEFRPCIDIHNGKVKQIVGGSLQDQGDQAKENFVAEQDASFYAEFYKKDCIQGGHVILLNSRDSEYYEKTKEQAMQALKAYPDGLQIGGGISAENAAEFLKAGAASSFLLRDGKVVILSGNSLPAGILQGISYDRRSIPLREGDVLVLVTDGALPISEQWFADELQAIGTLPPKEAAEKLALLAKRRQQQPEDDITVAVAKVCRTA